MNRWLLAAAAFSLSIGCTLLIERCGSVRHSSDAVGGGIDSSLRNSPLKKGELGLPPEFAKYREWVPLLDAPRRVPLELWTRCMAPTPADWKAASARYGPHAERLIQVYRRGATAKPADGGSASLPLGTAIAKEKLSGKMDGSAEGVAFMVKRRVVEFPTSDGWEFLFFPSAGDNRATHEACASCHRAARSRDYIFGDYP